MLMEGKFTLKAPIQEVWDFLMLDPTTLVSCIPGAEKMVAVDDKTLECTIKQRVGIISVKLQVTVTFTEVDPPTHLKFVGRGSALGGMGTATLESVADLREVAPGEVEVSYNANVSMVGRLATFGERIMRAKIDSTSLELTNNLANKLKEVQSKKA
jgi:carbon monoxide dehydrogenase subunit G